MNLKESLEAIKGIVDIPITINNSENTAYITEGHNTPRNSSININKEEIDNIMPQILKRNYNEKYKYLQIVLHEIAHYKQHKKHEDNMIKKPLKKVNKKHFEKLDIKDEYHNRRVWYFTKEAIADRYALRYYKKFLKKSI